MTAADTMTKMREEVFGAIRTFTAATVAEAEQATSAILRIAYNESPYPLSAQQREPVVRVKDILDRRIRLEGCRTDELSIRQMIRSYYDGALGHDPEYAKSCAEAFFAAVEIQSSDGGVEGHAPEGSASVAVRGLRERRPRDMEAAGSQREAETGWSPEMARVRERASNCVSQDSDRIAGPAAARGRAGIKPGPSEAIADVESDPASGRSQPSPDVSVDDDVAHRITSSIPPLADVSVDELEAFIGSLEPDSMAAARALLARYRIERLDRIASSGRR